MQPLPRMGHLRSATTATATGSSMRRPRPRTAEYARASRAARRGEGRSPATACRTSERVSLDVFVYDLEHEPAHGALSSAFAACRSARWAASHRALSDLLLRQPGRDAGATPSRCWRAWPRYPRRVDQELASPARRRRARLGAAAHGARARPRAARRAARRGARPEPVRRALQPARQRHPGGRADGAAGAGAGAASPTHVLPARAPAARLRRRRIPAEGAGRRRARATPTAPPSTPTQVRSATTTDLTPAQIHAIGLREVERLRREMDAVRREVGFDGRLRRLRRAT